MAKLKHSGIIKRTGTKCIVISHWLEAKPDFCLIVETDTLPNQFRDKLLEVLHSQFGQQCKNFIDALHRNMFSNSTNMLDALHNAGFIKRVLTKEVTMVIDQSVQISLDELVTQMRAKEGLIPADQANPSNEPTTLNMHNMNMEAMKIDDKFNTAKNLMVQAKMLEEDANTNKKEAERYFPGIMKMFDGKSSQDSMFLKLPETDEKPMNVISNGAEQVDSDMLEKKVTEAMTANPSIDIDQIKQMVTAIVRETIQNVKETSDKKPKKPKSE